MEELNLGLGTCMQISLCLVVVGMKIFFKRVVSSFSIGLLLLLPLTVEGSESDGVPMDMEIANAEGEVHTLREWMGESKVMLVDFWASWCGPCIRAMPSLKAKADALPEQGVFVVAMNIDNSNQVALARKVREQRGMGSVPWLIDPKGGSLSDQLGIDTIPRVLLVDRDGEILYNGHPLDPALGVALQKLGVTPAH